MTTSKKIARRKLSLLQLAQELGNVSKACRLMGYSRQQFYEIRRNYQTYGAEGLLDRLPGDPRCSIRTGSAPRWEEAILAHCLDAPTHGCLRVAQELALKGVQVSAGGVRERLGPPQPAVQARAPAAPRAAHPEAPGPTDRRADPAPGALQSGVPRSPHRDPRHRGAGRGGHLPRGHPQGRGTGLHAGGHRLPQPLRLGPALHQQAAAHGRAAAQQPGPADLREARGLRLCRPLGQRPRIYAAGRIGIPTSSSCSWKASSTAPPR